MNDEMIAKELKEVRECVFGNGKPGLKYEIVKLKISLKFNTVLTGIIASAMVTGVVKLMFFM